jgi:Cu/Ag efflux pump CusA
LLKRWYAAVLPPLIRHPQAVAAFALVVLVAAGFSVQFLGDELMPKFKETDFLMHWVEKPGIGVEAMNRITIAASKELRSVEGVKNFGSHIGRAEVADEVYGPNFTELWISISRRWVSGAVSRPTDLPNGTDQGGLDRFQRCDCRAYFWPEPG